MFLNNSIIKLYYFPTIYQYAIEQLLLFIKNLINSNIGSFFLRYFVVIFSVFIFILLMNLFGMVPYSFTVTSHLIVTFFISFLCFFAINYIGIFRHGLFFFGLFFPEGSPLFLAPLLVFIELLSYIARVFSLAIRLFANLMSGHTLLKILSEFAWAMLTGLGLMSFFFIFPIVIIFLITGLEIAIACLQAYVFTILVCIYLNDSIHLH
jgi:ATP synthase subunit 6